MRRNIKRFSCRKNLRRKDKKRKTINFAKNDRYTLDSRIIKKRVEKDVLLFKKHLKKDRAVIAVEIRCRLHEYLSFAFRYFVSILRVTEDMQRKPHSAIYLHI